MLLDLSAYGHASFLYAPWGKEPLYVCISYIQSGGNELVQHAVVRELG